ncbi:MAG: hypothetical protein JWM98_92 [Thermoleophilia bacterium]|nr:hypothetical protein [Thermoleophilia bacterium]
MTIAPHPTRTQTSVDARVAAACLPGFPVTTRRLLRGAGVDRRAVSRRTADGTWTRLWGDTFLIGALPDPMPPDLLRAAAIATVGPNSALDGTSALHRLGVWPRHDGSIQVVSERWHRPVPAHRIVFVRSAAPPMAGDTIMCDGLPTVSVIRAVFAAARVLTPYQLAFVLRECEYAHLTTLDEIEAELARRRGERGTRTLRRAIELRRQGSAGTRSRSEDHLLPGLTVRFGVPLVNVRGAAGLPDYEPDFAWPDLRRIVELDGDHHVEDPLQRAADRARDDVLRAAGWTVVRVPHRDVWRAFGDVLDRLDAVFSAS